MAACMAAVSAGEPTRAEPFLAEDVCYLLSGEPPMRGRAAFLQAVEALLAHCAIAAELEIRELQLMGDFAYCLNWLTLTLQPRNDEQPRKRSGYTLTLLRREPDGRWVIFRNANLIAEL